jgi:hypothetical protein
MLRVEGLLAAAHAGFVGNASKSSDYLRKARVYQLHTGSTPTSC